MNHKTIGTAALLLGVLAVVSCTRRGEAWHPPGSAVDSAYIPVDSARQMISKCISGTSREWTAFATSRRRSI